MYLIPSWSQLWKDNLHHYLQCKVFLFLARNCPICLSCAPSEKLMTVASCIRTIRESITITFFNYLDKVCVFFRQFNRSIGPSFVSYFFFEHAQLCFTIFQRKSLKIDLCIHEIIAVVVIDVRSVQNNGYLNQHQDECRTRIIIIKSRSAVATYSNNTGFLPCSSGDVF